MVAILDADKEGFLRSETSLIQTIGRAARNDHGRVILYADKITGSIERALAETKRRREKQIAYNKEHNITPKSIQKNVPDILQSLCNLDYTDTNVEEKEIALSEKDFEKRIQTLEKQMKEEAENLNFERAIELRNQITQLKKNKIGV